MVGNEIESIGDVIELANRSSRFWYRGQSKTFDELQPRVFRPEYSCFQEIDIYNQFKVAAPAFYSSCPEPGDNISWLFLMQHYGLPTRLLDWTRSVLVALMFCVKDNLESDGGLWVMDFLKLNGRSNMDSLPILHVDKLCGYCFAEPHFKKAGKLDGNEVLNAGKKLFGLSDVPVEPIAIEPIIGFARMQAQQSRFTIHPIKSKGEKWHLKDGCAAYYKVPKEKKADLLLSLWRIGISETTLFPSLDGLSTDLIRFKS